ncbi:MAG: restriction endonuclease subunit S [Betaproteobacteria bacterium]|nr:restriction endonuclease subunit S [Betaproteobacteria bacterium]
MNWTTASLGEVTQILSGTTPDSGNPALWGGAHVWVTPTDLGKLDGLTICESARHISDLALRERSLPLIPKNAVVMSSRAPIGHLAIAGCELYTNQGCKSFVCGEALDFEFLFFNLRHRMVDIQSLGSGSTFMEVSKSALEGFEICFPHIDDQRQIAAHLKAQLTIVATARQATQVQLKDAALLRQRLLRQTFDALADEPHKVLGEWATIISGVTPARDKGHYWQPAEVPWVKTGEIDFAPITSVQESISKKALTECSLSLLPPKTVLVAITGEGKTRGRSAVLEVAATTNQHSVSILPNDTWDAYFLQLWMQSSYHDLRELSEGRGGSRSALSGGQMKALEIPAPDIGAQRRIVDLLKKQLAEVDALRAALEQQLRDLDALPQRILALAFNLETAVDR